VETKGTLQEALFEAQEVTLDEMDTPYFLSGFILPDPEFAPPD
jgi:hypothetical protein